MLHGHCAVPDSHCSEGLVPAARNALAESFQLSVPFKDSLRQRAAMPKVTLLPRLAHIQWERNTKAWPSQYNLGINLKGHSNSRSLCVVSQGCHWTSIMAKYLYIIKIMPLISSIFKVCLFLTQFLSLAIDVMVIYSARGCWCPRAFLFIFGWLLTSSLFPCQDSWSVLPCHPNFLFAFWLWAWKFAYLFWHIIRIHSLVL